MATILVGPEETKFVVHQALLCEKSPYFIKALTGSFEESKTDIVKLEHVSPVLFKIVVSWLYYDKIVYTVSEDGLDIGPSFARFKSPSELLAEETNADNTSTWPKQVYLIRTLPFDCWSVRLPKFASFGRWSPEGDTAVVRRSPQADEVRYHLSISGEFSLYPGRCRRSTDFFPVNSCSCSGSTALLPTVHLFSYNRRRNGWTRKRTR
jgi:hypothetical protein